MSRSDPNTSVHSSKGRLVVTRMEPRSQRWLKTSKSSSATISRPRWNSFRCRLSSRLSSLAPSGPLYPVFTGATPQPAALAGNSPVYGHRLEIPTICSSGGWLEKPVYFSLAGRYTFAHSSQGCSRMTLYGYARVSVREPEDKNLDLQVERLVRAGCSLGNIRSEEASGARNDRGGLLELLDPGGRGGHPDGHPH